MKLLPFSCRFGQTHHTIITADCQHNAKHQMLLDQQLDSMLPLKWRISNPDLACPCLVSSLQVNKVAWAVSSTRSYKGVMAACGKLQQHACYLLLLCVQASLKLRCTQEQLNRNLRSRGLPNHLRTLQETFQNIVCLTTCNLKCSLVLKGSVLSRACKSQVQPMSPNVAPRHEH